MSHRVRRKRVMEDGTVRHGGMRPHLNGPHSHVLRSLTFGTTKVAPHNYNKLREHFGLLPVPTPRAIVSPLRKKNMPR